MAEDTTKKGENGESEEPENKDWDWEAATPDAPTDTLDLAELSHDAVHEQTAEEAEESDENGDEEAKTVATPVKVIVLSLAACVGAGIFYVLIIDKK